MKKYAKINIKGNIYKVSLFDVIQVELPNCRRGEVHEIYGANYVKVTLKVIEKLSTTLALMEVEKIEFPEQLEMDLDKMTKKDLIQYVKDNDLDVDIKLKKAELLEEIKSYI